MEPVDYDEIVTVIWNEDATTSSKDTAASSGKRDCSLKDAVLMIMDEWRGSPRRSVNIILPDGKPPITAYDDVRAIYEREDFPAN
ncbi:hypothetical protein [Methylobacterium durans]|uniref:Uncharacterized protein n=1 Tax=Methylobacterium durans TaxID=2202825 RepID=A0A2U8WCH7_9HYPH|nr:hypothetical protein [Methylobacterium durans]AWN43150.1 hypothetical protein DK389_24975 [Methylobacterium durans]